MLLIVYLFQLALTNTCITNTILINAPIRTYIPCYNRDFYNKCMYKVLGTLLYFTFTKCRLLYVTFTKIVMYYPYAFLKIKVGVQRLLQKSNFRLILILLSHNIKNKNDIYSRKIQCISQDHFLSIKNFNVF